MNMRELLLSLFLFITCTGIKAYNPDASNIHTVGKFVFELNYSSGKLNGYATLIDVKPGVELEGEITIPGSITVEGTRYEVNHIGNIYTSFKFFEYERAIRDMPGITRVNIPSTITDIGNMEFLGCTGINEFHVNAGNKNFKDVDGVLFYRWDEESSWSLFRMPPARPKTKYTLPDDVHGIEQCAFADHKTLRQLILSPECNLNNELWAWGNKSIKEIDVTNCKDYKSRDGIIFESWGDGVELVACPPGLKLDRYVIPKDCHTINGGAFCNSSISVIKLPDNISLYNCVFAGSDLKELECTASSLRSARGDLCVMAEKLEKIHIKSDSKEKVLITDYAFANCKSLREVVFDSDSVELETGTFLGCTSLKEFPFSSIVAMKGHVIDGIYSGRQFEGSGLVSVSFPRSLDLIPAHCFIDCPSLSDVRVNENATTTKTIGCGAFKNCPSLNTFNFEGVTYVGGGAFENTPLTKIILPAREEEYGKINFGLCFEYLPETRCYFDSPYIGWVSAYGSTTYVEGTYIVSSTEKKKSCLPNYWKQLYCPAGMKEWYDKNSRRDIGWGGEVTELFSLQCPSGSSYVMVIPNPDLSEVKFEITGVSVDGTPAVDEGNGKWTVAKTISSSHSDIRIDYSVDDVPMSSTYHPELLSQIEECKDISGFPGKIKGIYDLSGNCFGVESTGLRSGIYIFSFEDGSVEKRYIK